MPWTGKDKGDNHIVRGEHGSVGWSRYPVGRRIPPADMGTEKGSRTDSRPSSYRAPSRQLGSQNTRRHSPAPSSRRSASGNFVNPPSRDSPPPESLAQDPVSQGEQSAPPSEGGSAKTSDSYVPFNSLQAIRAYKAKTFTNDDYSAMEPEDRTKFEAWLEAQDTQNAGTDGKKKKGKKKAKPKETDTIPESAGGD